LSHLPAEVSRSNQAAEEILVWLKGRWAGQAANFRNAERTNRLLKLYVHHQRHTDDLRDYSQVVRRYLGSHGGFTEPPRQGVDHGAQPGATPSKKPSLRF
jgi:hypothetical protein